MKALTLFLALIIPIALGFHRIGYAAEKSEWDSRDTQLKQLQASLNIIASQIQKSQGKGKCESSEHCRILGMGTKICDEFKDYLIYSTFDTNEKILPGLVSEFNKTHRKLIDKTLTAGQCGVKPVTVQCVAKRCAPDLPESKKGP